MSPSLPLLSTQKKNNQRQYLCLAENSPAKGPSLPEWQERTINGVGSDRAVATTGNKERTLCCGLWCHLFPGFLDVEMRFFSQGLKMKLSTTGFLVHLHFLPSHKLKCWSQHNKAEEEQAGWDLSVQTPVCVFPRSAPASLGSQEYRDLSVVNLWTYKWPEGLSILPETP